MMHDSIKINAFFDFFEKQLQKYEFHWDDVWNMNEKRFALSVKESLKVVCFKVNFDDISRLTQCDNKKWFTIIECVNVMKFKLRLWFIMKEVKQMISWMKILNDNKLDHIFTNEIDWFNNTIEFNWLKHCFELETIKCQKNKSRCLIVDDHFSHVTKKIIEFCIEKKIVLLCLFAYTTHLLQFLNVDFF